MFKKWLIKKKNQKVQRILPQILSPIEIIYQIIQAKQKLCLVELSEHCMISVILVKKNPPNLM